MPITEKLRLVTVNFQGYSPEALNFTFKFLPGTVRFAVPVKDLLPERRAGKSFKI